MEADPGAVAAAVDSGWKWVVPGILVWGGAAAAVWLWLGRFTAAADARAMANARRRRSAAARAHRRGGGKGTLRRGPAHVPCPELVGVDAGLVGHDGTLATTPSDFNPFINDTRHLTPWTRAATALAAVTVLPIRMALLAGLSTIAIVFANLAMVGMRGPQRPLPLWRRVVRWPAAAATRLVFPLCLSMWWVSVDDKRGGAQKDEAPHLIVSNHVGFLEPVLLSVRHMASAVSRAEAFDVPAVLFNVQRAMVNIFVDRKSAASRAAVEAEIELRASAEGRAQGWPPLLVFPEGATSNGRAVLQFKLGAFTPGVPVQPVVVRYPHRHLNPSTVTCGVHFPALIVRLVCSMYTQCSLTYLPPVHPTEEERRNPHLFAERVRTVMSRELGVPLTRHGFDDVLIQRRAKLSDVAVAEVPHFVTEWYSFHEGFDLTLKQVLPFVDAFAGADVTGECVVDVVGFAEAIDGLLPAPEVRPQRDPCCVLLALRATALA